MQSYREWFDQSGIGQAEVFRHTQQIAGGHIYAVAEKAWVAGHAHETDIGADIVMARVAKLAVITVNGGLAKHTVAGLPGAELVEVEPAGCSGGLARVDEHGETEELRRRRLSEAQVRLSEQRAQYTDAHPVIIDLQQTIAALEVPSPQIKALRAEVAALRSEQEKLGGEGGSASVAPPAEGSPRLAPIPNDIVRLDEELR